jgi:glycosyltransferase involved in cell wall biosynthesis
LFLLYTVDNPANIIQISDVCVHPSLSEAFSLSILEYMSGNKPVVIPERICNTVYNRNNCAVYKDADQLVNCLNDIIAGGRNPALLQNASDTANRYSIRNTAFEYLRLYKNI